MAEPRTSDPGAFVRGPADGETITQREGRQVVVLAEREQITITWYRIGPGERGPALHVHHEHTDAFYVLDGELSLVLGPDREHVRVGAGGLVAAPPHVVHTFLNDGGAEARFLNLHTPDGGFGAYMRARRDGDENATFDSFDPPPGGGLPLSAAILAGPGEGERLLAGARMALVKAALPELFLAEFEIEAGFDGPGLHEHETEVDSFYVLDGEIEVTIGDSTRAAGPGALASIPPGVRHRFAYRGPGRARFLNIHAPDAGFADFLRRVSD